MKSYLTQIRMNLRLTLRDRTILFFSYLFPLIFFFIFGQTMHAEQGGTAPQVVNMVLSIGVLGTGFFGGGMRAVMDREQNILRRFKVAPITAAPILISGLITGLVQFLPLVVLVLTMANLFYGMPWPAHMFSLFALLSLGVLAFRAIGGMIAAVANSMQESQVIIQLLYFPMLFLSGATMPISIMPNWLQITAQFLPSTYLSTGLQSILLRRGTIADNLPAAAALALTMLVATFLGVKLFRWEKEEKMRASAKLWLVAVMAPFLLMGVWQARAKDNVVRARSLERDLSRNRTVLIHNVRVFAGDGSVIERGSVLIKDGKIGEVYSGDAPAAKSLKAEEIDAAGKTLMPGLIDVHVHLGSPGGAWETTAEWGAVDKNIDRALAAYLFSGVTAVKSAGDALDTILKHRAALASGDKEGAELFVVGPMFTAPKGHGTEIAQALPEQLRDAFQQQVVRLPKTPEEARQQVAELKARGVDGIKAILEGQPPFVRLDPAILRGVVEGARAAGLPIVCHTGDARDVADAVDAGVNGIEHGSFRDVIPEALFARMKQAGVAYDPTLAVFEASIAASQGKTELLDRSLVQQVGPPSLLSGTKKMLSGQTGRPFSNTIPYGRQNLMAAYGAGVTLVTGTDSGNPLMIHGPGIHRELQLWVAAGVPPAVALQAATYNGARLLGAGNRMGLIRSGYVASLLLVDGNPLTDISATERISMVVYKGERVNRSELFKQD